MLNEATLILKQNARLLLAMSVISAIVAADAAGALALTEPLQPLSDLTTATAAMLLRQLGFEAIAIGNEIFESAGFGYIVDYRCTNVWPILIFATLVATDLNITRSRLTWLATGIILLVAVNLVRLVSLYAVGVHAPGLFGPLHNAVWPATTLALVTWMWLRASNRVLFKIRLDVRAAQRPITLDTTTRRSAARAGRSA